MPPLSEWLNGQPRPIIVAHRAGPSLGPENSLPALEESAKIGVKLVEVDVRLSRDGAAVLHHDPVLLRSARQPWRISRLTQTRLAKVDISGSWHETYGVVSIPTLQQALQQYSDKLYFWLDLKPRSGHQAELAKAVVALIKKFQLDDQVIVSAFSSKVVRLVKAELPEVLAAHNCPTAVSPLMGSLEQVEIMSFHYHLATRRRFAHWQDQQKLVATWTIDTELELALAKEARPDFVVSNHPDRALRFFKHK